MSGSNAGGRSHSGGEKAAANLGRKAIGDAFVAGRDLSDAGHVLVFKDAEGEIELGVVVLQKLDEGLDLGRGEVEAGCDFSGLGETGDGVGVFDFGEEVQDEKVDVLDLVIAEPDTLVGGHFGGNVSADAKAVLVGFVDDGGDEGRLDGAVDFDLHVAETFVVVDGGSGFGFGGDENFGGTLVGPGAVDDAGEDDASADLLALGNALAAGEERVGVIGEIADGGDSGGEVEEAVVIADVGVHVPEAGEEGFAASVDYLGAGGVRGRRAEASSLRIKNFKDARARNDDGLIVNDFSRFGVENVGVSEDELAGRGDARASRPNLRSGIVLLCPARP